MREFIAPVKVERVQMKPLQRSKVISLIGTSIWALKLADVNLSLGPTCY